VLLYVVQPDDALARELFEECTELGHFVVRVGDASPDAVRDLGEDRPDAVLVCLDAAPDEALDLADALVGRRRLRGVPLVFAGGTQAALNRAQEAYPRASFARRDVLLSVLASLKS